LLPELQFSFGDVVGGLYTGQRLNTNNGGGAARVGRAANLAPSSAA